MTCIEKYAQEHSFPVKGCPHDYGYLDKPKECYSMSCFKDCWFRETNDTYNDDCINESKESCKNFLEE